MRKIIIVDDQPSFRYSLKNILESIGEVEIIGEASDGIEFLSLLKRLTPDLVFMDIEMPNMGGVEATKRALQINPNLIIIGISMYENQNYINQLIEAGAKGYLLKTGNNADLFRLILEKPDNQMFYSTGISFQSQNTVAGKKVVAIVDDFETTTFTIEFALKNAGYNVIKANDPNEILKFFDGRQIDLLISDYQMPQMLGHELVEKVKQLPNYKNIPVLMVSSERSEEKQRLSRDAGAFGWIQKPYDLKRFMKIVERVLL